MKLKGKLIGGILGACFGGPFGIALGVAIGHVCDSVADSSEVSLAARSKFIELACEGISKIAKADGRVSEAWSGRTNPSSGYAAAVSAYLTGGGQAYQDFLTSQYRIMKLQRES